MASAINIRLAQINRGIDLASEGLKIRRCGPRLLGMRSLYSQLYDVVKHISVKTES